MRYIRPICGMFAKSPFKLLYDHALKGYEATLKLEEVIKAYCDRDRKRLEELGTEISNLEFEADQIKQEIRRRLPSSILLPVDRQDVLSFLKPQDTIADRAEDVSRITTFKEPPELPKEIKDELLEMTRAVITTVEAYEKAVSKIKGMAMTSFRRKEVKETLELIPPVEKLEHDTDIIQLDLTKKIYALEGSISPIDIYHLSLIIKTLDDVADSASRAADRLRTMISR
ncbi:MAG: TIGR00153 family protein [Candidatus Syntropharchaeia archaeon]